jgi:hypothetical protein
MPSENIVLIQINLSSFSAYFSQNKVAISQISGFDTKDGKKLEDGNLVNFVLTQSNADVDFYMVFTTTSQEKTNPSSTVKNNKNKSRKTESINEQLVSVDVSCVFFLTCS